MGNKRIIDMTGQKIGRLTIIEKSGNTKGGGAKWLCRCDCGNEIIVIGSDIRRGHTQSCGCIHSEGIAKRNYKHGETRSKLYNSWCAIKQRCDYENGTGYHNYGDKGVTVCTEWRENFQKFYEWAMQNGYHEGLTIDRIDPDGNYEPSNCRWATKKEQANNKTDNVRITVNGETHTAAEWSEITGEKAANIRNRINRGYPPEKAIEKSNNNLHLITVNGETHTIKEWAYINNINASTILHRLKRGWDEEKAVTEQVKKGGQ